MPIDWQGCARLAGAGPLRHRPIYLRLVARAPRIQIAGGLYHVTTRAKSEIFLDDDDRTSFLATLRHVIRRHGWICHSYCLLSTHYHVLVSTPNPDLPEGMQRLNGRYAQGFNDRYLDFGHVFSGRYYSVLVESEGHLLELVRYLALNPVRAGICRTPRSWRWSSYASALGLRPVQSFLSLDWVLSLFGQDLERARERLREFVER